VAIWLTTVAAKLSSLFSARLSSFRVSSASGAPATRLDILVSTSA